MLSGSIAEATMPEESMQTAANGLILSSCPALARFIAVLSRTP
jgi:hypothetical protein